MATTNYNLPTITGNMTADVVRDMNALAEATDEAIKEAVDGVDLSTVTQQIGAVDQRVTTHLAESNTIAHKAKSIVLEDVTGLFVAGNLEDGMKELFTNVSNGKRLVGTAITDVDDSKFVPSNPSFLQLADLIRTFTQLRKRASGNVTTSGSGSDIPITVTGLNFKPYLVVLKNVNQTNKSNSFSVYTDLSGLGSASGISFSRSTFNTGVNPGSYVFNDTGFSVTVADSGPYVWLAFE